MVMPNTLAQDTRFHTPRDTPDSASPCGKRVPAEVVSARADKAYREGPHRRRKSMSWAPDVDVPATIPCWSSKRQWEEDLGEAVLSDEGLALCQRSKRDWVAPPTVMAVAKVDAGSAESATGRGVRTSHRTVARTLGRSVDTVKNARRVIERLGFAVVVDQGRYLTEEEQDLAREHHGNEQIRIASERVLTTPRPQVSPPLPRRGPVGHLPHPNLGSPKRANARAAQKSTTQTNPPVTRPKRTHTPARCSQSYDRGLQKLAAKLALRVPWLGRGHIGALCQTLALAGVDPTRWDAPGLLWAIDTRNRELGWDAPIPETPHRRLRLLAYQLAQVLPAYAGTMTPTEAAWRRAAEAKRRAEAQAAAAEEPVERACPAEDPALAQDLRQIRERAQAEAEAQKAQQEAMRAQAEADKAERAARAKAQRAAAGAAPGAAGAARDETAAERLLWRKSRWQRLGIAAAVPPTAGTALAGVA